MICQECNERPATLHFTKIINGEKTEVHLCEHCAQEKSEVFIIEGDPGFSINNLLAGLLNIDSGFQKTKENSFPKHEILQCDVCHMTYQQFVNVGRFGCSHCYETFKDRIKPIFKRLHSGNIVHQGKIPKRVGGSLHLKKEIKELKTQLQTLIINEEFEKAAEVRDRIRSLELQLDSKRGESS
ncbi:protein arginine kinase activator [Oikeobacillus pervagus]|uniref:Protein arginine kinase activator n=1 Tax=Oikeobacillus pervagus TaxID=1325931 RepID=A0AAJ1SZD5_9BACI|nr:UvrB/UvrC motif-containing protein [Oikeobacillus pervagus]MDQ0215680.1 protein arginine kinase activator [Oikeobacillus pervagus]